MFVTDLESRRKKILKAIITSYIDTGYPIGSKTVCRLCRLNLSPASIRNIMRSLEEGGFITHPHTSAGRIPTDSGYRYYVDFLMQLEQLSEQAQQDIRSNCQYEGIGLEDFFHNISKSLSEFTDQIAIVFFPKFANGLLKELQFLSIGNDKVLAIVLTQAGLVKSKTFRYKKTKDQRHLRHIAIFINNLCYAKKINQLKTILSNELQTLSDSSYATCKEAIEILKMVDLTTDEDRIYLDGTHHLLSKSEFHNPQRSRVLLETLEHKWDLLECLEDNLDAESIKIFIGKENTCDRIQDCSLVLTPYKINDTLTGVLGVLGPTRMSYNSIIPTVEYMANLVNDFSFTLL